MGIMTVSLISGRWQSAKGWDRDLGWKKGWVQRGSSELCVGHHCLLPAIPLPAPPAMVSLSVVGAVGLPEFQTRSRAKNGNKRL